MNVLRKTPSARFDPRVNYAGARPSQMGAPAAAPAKATPPVTSQTGAAPRQRVGAPIDLLANVSWAHPGAQLPAKRGAPVMVAAALPLPASAPARPVLPVASGTIRNDARGHGHFAAGRGDRPHAGLDLLVTPGEPVKAPWAGTVTKNGWVYDGDARYRFVEIFTDAGDNVRLLYTAPGLAEGARVQPGDVIGTAQDVSLKWGGGMLPHVELQVRKGGRPRTRLGTLVDPAPLLGFTS